MGYIACSSSNSLVPVITVQLGEPVTFTCALPNVEISHRTLYWYRQSAGDTLKLIVTQRKFGKPEYTPEFPESRLEANTDKNFINLTIIRTTQEDEGMYHCTVAEWISNPVWSGTYLLLKGNSQKTSNYAVNGTKLDQGTCMWSQTASAVIFLLCAVLVLSLIVIASLICVIKTNKCNCFNAAVALQNSGIQESQRRDEDTWLYSAVVFTMMKTASCEIQDATSAERERIYAAVKAFGLD
ncbi:uncharacterized protein LOC111648332 isoform X2 [Seriola lalandi dorsalis]|uniref:uncharacterized protein LOC111648332 isoform X2 n=1 Tax=Seriola lalandi dorsalis TaxID=1841481 RepID=UPI000C6FA6FE|nr:uncharacterized protein LOC111648332 isoform X2 [Seriola lalandi dorsalis]